MTTATVAANQLRPLITDLLRTADTDTSLPMLVGIRLHGDTFAGQKVIVGFSTDRFTMGQAHAEATGDLPEFFLPSASCKRILAALKMIGPAALVELTVGAAALSFAGDGLTISVPTAQVDFPKSHRIFESLDKLEPAAGVVAAFEPRKFNRFAMIAKDRDEPLHIGLTTATNATLITIGDRYRGLLMPMRKDPVSVPWFLAPSEQAAVEQAKADKAAAEAKAKRSAAAKKAAVTRAARKSDSAPTPARATRKRAA